MDLTVIIGYTPYILILSGAMPLLWLYEKLTGEITMLASFFGFFVGILSLMNGAMVWARNAGDAMTLFLLIVIGLSLFLKPIKNIRWASLLGLIAGCAGVAFVLVNFSQYANTRILGAVFIAIALAVYIASKFAEDVLHNIGTILSFPPVALLLGLLCISQGILLLLGKTLLMYI